MRRFIITTMAAAVVGCIISVPGVSPARIESKAKVARYNPFHHDGKSCKLKHALVRITDSNKENLGDQVARKAVRIHQSWPPSGEAGIDFSWLVRKHYRRSLVVCKVVKESWQDIGADGAYLGVKRWKVPHSAKHSHGHFRWSPPGGLPYRVYIYLRYR